MSNPGRPTTIQWLQCTIILKSLFSKSRLLSFSLCYYIWCMYMIQLCSHANVSTSSMHTLGSWTIWQMYLIFIHVCIMCVPHSFVVYLSSSRYACYVPVLLASAYSCLHIPVLTTYCVCEALIPLIWRVLPANTGQNMNSLSIPGLHAVIRRDAILLEIFCICSTTLSLADKGLGTCYIRNEGENLIDFVSSELKWIGHQLRLKVEGCRVYMVRLDFPFRVSNIALGLIGLCLIVLKLCAWWLFLISIMNIAHHTVNYFVKIC